MGPRPPEERDGRETHATEGLGMGFRARSAAIPCRRLSGMGFRAAQPATDRGTHAAGLSGMGRILGARADGRTVRP